MHTVAVLGLGQRGAGYARWVRLLYGRRAQIVALCEQRTERLCSQAHFLGVPPEGCFTDEEAFFAAGRLAEAVFICTQDRDHIRHAKRAVELGYQILLEKPVSACVEEMEQLASLAEARGVEIVVCHVMRYMQFFHTLHTLVSDGAYGRLIGAEHTENIGYFHFAHSYVRGNWRREEETTPMLLAKCCHDFDFVDWLMGGGCKSVSSVGALAYFTPEHAPKGSAARCRDCDKAVRERCPYDAYRLYTGPVAGATFLRFLSYPLTGRAASALREKRAALDAGPYGRCVYRCDNDVCDRQATLLNYGGGRTAEITATAFSKRCFRRVILHLEGADIFGEDAKKRIVISPFLGKKKTIHIRESQKVHLLGDYEIVRSFLDLLDGNPMPGLTRIRDSIESHRLVMLAEASRLQGGARIPAERG